MRKKMLLNDLWQFSKQKIGTTLNSMNQPTIEWQDVDLPHDWLIVQVANLYEDSEGWYRRILNRQDLLLDSCYSLRFEGVYMNSFLYINGQLVGEWRYGYSTFEFDITDFLTEEYNEILVRVIHQAPNSRWYTGAGIYRNVFLLSYPSTHITSDGVFVEPKLDQDTALQTFDVSEQLRWKIHIATELSDHVYDTLPSIAYHPVLHTSDPIRNTVEDDLFTVPYQLQQTIYALSSTNDNARWITSFSNNIAFHSHHIQIKQTTELDHIQVWDITSPNRYLLVTELLQEGTIIDHYETTFGFRYITFDSMQGFFLNGRHLKLQGTCEHHDLGALGSTVNKEALRYRFQLLKDMGVNAIRTAHNMPSVEFMELADEMGFLIVSEAFDMWEKSKNPYDYSRFFQKWSSIDIASWIRRDRNHPSIILWSIGNEILDTHQDENGLRITKRLRNLVQFHDFYHHAFTTIGSNYMPWEHAKRCANEIEVVGYNYGERYYASHHEEHPNWCIYGSETSSIVQSRGIYHFPYSQSLLADDDEQCSSLGNSATSWGAKNSEYCLLTERDTPFSAGQFIWTGFDYIGEPTPYHTKNSYFGQIDTAGFVKDSYYLYQAMWTNYKTHPMIHLFPYWDFSIGQEIDLRICSNAPQIKVYFIRKNNNNNQKELLLERQQDLSKSKDLFAHLCIPYEPGSILAYAFDEAGQHIASDILSSFGNAYAIDLHSNKQSLRADSEDLLFLTISMIDKEGHLVCNANNRVSIEVNGPGCLLGLDNGDSTDFDEYRTSSRRLFSGKLMAIIGSTDSPGIITVTVHSLGVQENSITLVSKPSHILRGIRKHVPMFPIQANTEVPIRKISLIPTEGTHLTKENPSSSIIIQCDPPNSTYHDLSWRLTDSKGIDTNIATLTMDHDHSILTITGHYNGRVYVRCSCKNGSKHIRLFSQLQFDLSGFPESCINPYDFVCAGLYTRSNIELYNGNERGIATAREQESHIVFDNVAFGKWGTQTITLPIFSLDDSPVPIELWEGMKGENTSQLLTTILYQKPSIWNTYQETTFSLPKRITGKTTLCFSVNQKIHLKGFQCEPYDPFTHRLYASDCDHIYGDQFIKQENSITEIGNNVTIEYQELNFTNSSIQSIIICGRSLSLRNSIQVRFITTEETFQEIYEFDYNEKSQEQRFHIPPIHSLCTLQLLFLPGSNFNLDYIRFSTTERRVENALCTTTNSSGARAHPV